MFFVTVKFNRKSAVCIILSVAAVLIALILVFSRSDAEGVFRSTKLECTEDRVEYLCELGWEVDSATETEKTVLIPREFTGVYLEYNKLQKKQGFDLESFSGTEVSMFSYIVTNYESTDTVVATLYIHKGTVIAGDVHSTSLSGFMHGLK